MSQSPYHSPASDQQKMPIPAVETNGLGTAGFVVSLIGLALCGIPSIIGLLISAMALGKKPKGLATAGVVIGLVGLLELVAVGIAAFSVYRVAQTASESISAFGTEAQTHILSEQIGKKWLETGEVPTQAEGDAILDESTDLYGQPLIYETDGVSFSVRSCGPDGMVNTDDDIVAGPFLVPEETQDFDPEQEFEAEIEDLFKLNKNGGRSESDSGEPETDPESGPELTGDLFEDEN